MGGLEGLGSRLAELVKATGLSQGNFAARIDASPAFVSDIIRGVKRPGAEFLYRIREAFGVSVDWLLDGSGTMRGEQAVSIETFKFIAAQVMLARFAKIEGDPEAAKLLSGMTGVGASIDTGDLGDLLKPYLKAGEEIVLAAILYNGHIATTDSAERISGALNTAAAYYDSKRPLDVLKAAMGEQPTAPESKPAAGKSRPAQQNIGLSVKAAGRDYFEGSKKPKSK